MTITILHNQSLLDISIRLFGTAIGVLPLAIENNISMTDDLEVGKVLKVPAGGEFEQRLIADFFKNRNINPATAIDKIRLTEEFVDSNGGIEYWGIEIDFEVK